MGGSGAEHERRAKTAIGCASRLGINRAHKPAAPPDGRRIFSSDGGAVDLSLSPPTSAHLGTAKVLRDMREKIREAVILMAGSGSRLRRSPKSLPKPLTPVLGRPLISYTLDALADTGITKINLVVGHESER